MSAALFFFHLNPCQNVCFLEKARFDWQAGGYGTGGHLEEEGDDGLAPRVVLELLPVVPGAGVNTPGVLAVVGGGGIIG